MSALPRGLSAGQNPSWTLAFWNRVHRYRCLVQKFWWVLVFTLSLAFFGAAWYQITRPPTFLSTSTLAVDMEGGMATFGGDQGGGGNATFSQDLDTYLAGKMDQIKSGVVGQAAAAKLRAQYPGQPEGKVKLDTTARNAIITVSATGGDPVYTQRYLQAVVQSFLDARRKDREDINAEGFEKLNAQIPGARADLDADDKQINAFQRQHNLVNDKANANNASTELEGMRQKLAGLKEKLGRMTLITPEAAFNQANPAAGGNGSDARTQKSLELTAAETDYRQTRSDLDALNAVLEDRSRDLRPKHPIILALRGQIAAKQQHISSLLTQAREGNRNEREITAAAIADLEKAMPAAEQKALDTNLLLSELDKLTEKKTRDAKTYEDLQTALQKGLLVTKVKSDPLRVGQAASPGEPVPSSWTRALLLAAIAGLGAGVGVLAAIDRMDDRMGSINDFQLHFSEQVLGQIPVDASADQTELLRPDDPRHQLVESFRNLRSTLLFMPLEGARPKTLLVTSAVPNEGKSTLSSNLALVLAFAGMKTLLIDADLRRGAIHQSFGVTRDPGLTDVIGHNVNWKLAIRESGIENLHILPRGRNVPQPSEYLLNKNTDKLLQELYPLYDYIIIDSSPVLAADDTASLAPKIDATLFVVRMSFTSAKMTRKSLEVLYDRQANVPGVILNQVDTSSPEFVYYQYSEYYHAATDGDDQDGGAATPAKGKGKPAPAPAKPSRPTVEV